MLISNDKTIFVLWRQLLVVQTSLQTFTK